MRDVRLACFGPRRGVRTRNALVSLHVGKAAKPRAKASKPPKQDNPAAIRELAEARRRFVPPKRPESESKRSRHTEEAFLDGVREGWSISRSCWAAGVHERTVRRWKAASIASKREDGSYDDDFAVRWEEAYEAGCDRIEDEAHRRAIHGVEKPVYQGGVLVGTVTEYSDTLMGLVMRGKRPERYNTERHEHTGKDGAPMAMNLAIEFVNPGKAK